MTVSGSLQVTSNCDLDGADSVSLVAQKFIYNGSFVCCDNIFACQKLPTYVNVALNQQTCIDYVLSSAANDIKSRFCRSALTFQITYRSYLKLLSMNSDSLQFC